jgi:hypothetical protein
MSEDTFSPPATNDDYEAKISHEITWLLRRSKGAEPEPFGDPLSGVVLVAEGSAGAANARLVDALRRSLAAVKLDRAYVTWSSSVLLEEILSLEPAALVAIGPVAAYAIDSLGYPLVETEFSEAPEGSWFVWTKGSSGLRLPALAPALDDTYAKRRFWRTFLTLRELAPEGEPSLRS